MVRLNVNYSVNKSIIIIVATTEKHLTVFHRKTGGLLQHLILNYLEICKILSKNVGGHEW